MSPSHPGSRHRPALCYSSDCGLQLSTLLALTLLRPQSLAKACGYGSEFIVDHHFGLAESMK